MSEFNPDDYVSELDGAKTPEAVDAVFAKMALLPEADRKAALDAVEQYAVADWNKGLPKTGEMAQLKMVIEILEEAKDTPQGKMILASLEGQVDAVEGPALAQIILNIHRERGENAAPFIKTYAAEAAKLSDEDFGTTFGLLKLMVNVADKMTEETRPSPRSNPFRKPGGAAFHP